MKRVVYASELHLAKRRLPRKRKPVVKQPPVVVEFEGNEDRLKLHIKEKGICHLCGYHVPLPQRGNIDSLLCPSEDHIVPRSRGGKWRKGNIKLAHRWCNSKRSSRDVTDELKAEIRELFRQTFMNGRQRVAS